jgi:hypothetical protein
VKKNHFVPLWLCVAACASGGAIMTMNAFYDIPMGATESEVVATAGKPYSISHTDGGAVEYEYIERVKAGARDLEERRYVLVLKEGKVVSKYVKGSTPSPYLFDSYEMQTTQNDSSSPEE